MGRPRDRNERGAALVEFAVVAPLLLLLVFGIVDLGRALYTHVTIQEAAQEGALYGSFSPGNHALVVQRVLDSVQRPTLTSGEVTVVCVATDPLDPADAPDIVVRVAHDLDLITPIASLFGGSLSLESEVTATIFREVPCDPTP